jgi:tryptophan 2,3-dioxygenase
MSKTYPPVGYQDYLRVEKLTELQHPRSVEFGRPAHDEMLFIIVHQTYELWFKQILVELDSVRSTFMNTQINESEMGTAVARLERIVEIQKILISQITVLETMTPLDFLDFREFIFPASGFQSVQNRLIENKLGLKFETRLDFNSLPYHSYVSEEEKKKLIRSEDEKSLFDLVDAWLARTPFLKSDDFDFWTHYKEAVTASFDEDRATVKKNKLLKPGDLERNLKEIDASEATFTALFDESSFTELQKQGYFRLSYSALHAALLIQLYRDQPILHLPFRLITALQNIDEQMTTWRYRHSLMAHRMIGRKVGTGGSSGAAYLRGATDKHRIFNDFFNLATFLIPRSRLPDLPEVAKRKLGFTHG